MPFFLLHFAKKCENYIVKVIQSTSGCRQGYLAVVVPCCTPYKPFEDFIGVAGYEEMGVLDGFAGRGHVQVSLLSGIYISFLTLDRT